MFAFVGEASNAILFVCLGVFFVFLAGYTTALGARAYLVILQGTAAGLDEVKWPDETPFDWLPQSFYVLGMLAVWVVPAGFLARLLSGVLLPNDAPLRTTVLVALAVWLLFPAGMIATQHAGAAGRLLRHLRALLAFYALSAALLVAEAALLYFGLFTAHWVAAPVAAALGAAGLMVHARMLGRVGWLLTREGPLALEPGKPKKKKEKRVRAAVTDPWAEPGPPEEPPQAAPVYAPAEVAEPQPVKRPSYVEPPPDPYALADEPLPEQPAQPPQTELRKAEIEREVALRTREPPRPPESLFFSGVWSFPFYEASHRPLAWLASWGLGTLVVARILAYVWPF